MIDLILNLPPDIEFRSLQRIDQPNIKGWSVLLKRTGGKVTERGAYGLGQALTIKGAAEKAMAEIIAYETKQKELGDPVANRLSLNIKISL